MDTVVADLRAAKGMSDRRDYKGKHRVLRKLMDERPEEFYVDSTKGPFLGITHGPSGFRMHLPRAVVATDRLGKPPEKAARLSPAVAALAAQGRRRRRRADAVETPPAVESEVEPDPSDDIAIAAALSRAAVTRRRMKEVAAWVAVPGAIRERVRGGFAAPLPASAAMDSPDALISRIATGSLLLPGKRAAARESVPGPFARNAQLEKFAAIDYPGVADLFTPSIPVDAFNNAVWSDALPNPFGTRSTFGDNSQALRTPPQVAAAVSGLVAGAAAARDSERVSPMDVAMAAGQAAGTGWLGGLLLGKTIGVLAGMAPEQQKRLQDIGLWGGMLVGATKAVFGRK